MKDVEERDAVSSISELLDDLSAVDVKQRLDELAGQRESLLIIWRSLKAKERAKEKPEKKRIKVMKQPDDSSAAITHA